MSLYRTYRPQSFADVVGQEHVITTLEQAAKQDRLSHAYLFAGSRGTGKTSVARILAKILMTHAIKDEETRERIMKGVEEGTIVDLLEIDAASNRGIDDIRDLIEKIQFSPVIAGAKVYIIDEVHMLTKEAFNALLKTLEEPPSYAHFILATTELNKIPATIQSRCQCFAFRPVREEDIVRRLQFIADQERIVIDREALRVIASHVGGGMRDAISLLDQLRSLPKITLEDVQQRLGGTDEERLMGVLEALERCDTQAIVEAVRAVEEAGVALDLFLRQLLGTVRASLHATIGAGKAPDQVLRILDTLLQAIRDVRVAPVPGLVVEAAFLSLCTDPVAAREPVSVRIAAPVLTTATPAAPKAPASAKATAGGPAPAKAVPETEQLVESASAATVEAQDVTIENIRRVWDRVVSETTPPAVKMSLKNGIPEAVEEGKVVVRFSSGFHRDRVGQTEASRGVESVMEKIFRRQVRIECVLGDPATMATPGTDQVNLAEAAAEIF